MSSWFIRRANMASGPEEETTVIFGPDLESLTYGQGTSNTSYIWVNQEAVNAKVKKINFIAREGTVYFHKVKCTPVNGNTAVTEQICSVVNTAADSNTIKSVDVNVQFASDEYLGVNGSFKYQTGSGVTQKAFVVNLSTNKVSNVNSAQRLAFNVDVVVS